MSRPNALPTGVASLGGLLPAETLLRVAGGKDLPGCKSADYHLGAGETANDAAERSWTYLRGRYAAFKEQLDKQPEGDPAVGITREYWLTRLFHELGFGRLPAVPAGGLAADGEKHFAVSHHWEHVPIHLLGWGVPLDTRSKGVPGAADSAPQSLVQEYLNHSAAALWGIVTNGRLLRVLRDSSALAGSAYVEVDLEAIFDGELYNDFVLLYRLAHVSRFELRGEDTGPASCWLEKWRQEAIDSGARVLDQLRVTVREAIETFGTGFIRHPDNAALRAALADSGNQAITPETLHRALLRIVYRLLFLFVAEDRDVLLDPRASAEARDRYTTYFAAARLRRIAARRRGDRHGDQWQALSLVLGGLGQEGGLPALALPALGGIFESIDADTALQGVGLANEDLFKAVKSLSRVKDTKTRRIRPVDFRHLGAEELGSVYESLLEYIPKHDPAQGTFELFQLSGNERKTTGSYYTPSSLIDCLLDSALDPVIDDAVKSGRTKEEQEAALLALTICDPACGSGHFLVAAARRVAKRLAFVRTGDPEPSNEEVRHALREVVSCCIYGVDLNPMAIELAKVSLWLEAVEPGKPLGFLDAHLKVGNALLGTTPKLVTGGLPDDAFKAIEGDDKKWVTALKKRNKDERQKFEDRERDLARGALFSVQDELFDDTGLRTGNNGLARRAIAITEARHDTLTDVHAQAAAFRKLQESPEYLAAKQLADAWCAAFVWVKVKESAPAVTTRILLDLQHTPARVSSLTKAELAELVRQYSFFHWHLEFPEVFTVPDDEDAPGLDDRIGWIGGFTCVLGNPPWERVKIQEQEFFASRHEGIFKARNAAARKKLIAALGTSDDAADRRLDQEFRAELRLSGGISHLLRESGRYPTTGSGDINTYAVFAETGRTLLHPTGRAGMVLPTGIATDATTAPFFGDLVVTKSLISVYEFENEEKLFPAVDHRVRFCLFSLAGRSVDIDKISLAFRARQVPQIDGKRFTLTPEDIARLNPNTLTCPVFDDPRHAQIVTDIYRRVPVLWREQPEANPWALSFLRMLDMANDSGLFRTHDDLIGDGWKLVGTAFVKGGERMLPLYEAKMIHHFNSRFSTYESATQAQLNVGTLPRLAVEQHADPTLLPLPRYWVAEKEVDDRLKRRGWDKGWLLGWRDMCRSSDERTVIASVLPKVGVGHKFPLALAARSAPLLVSNLSSFIFDYVGRQKFAGTSMTYFILKQLPAIPPEAYEQPVAWLGGSAAAQWIRERVLELSYTAYDIKAFAVELGDDGPPFVWDEGRRFVMRAELDAAYFHLYGVERDDVGYIMDSFRAFQNNDPERFARTKQLILDVYDAMAEAARTGEPYRTLLDPPPGQGPRHPESSRA